MKRPRRHVLETESTLVLQLRRPEWVWRELDPDYGLDLELTIVEDERVTEKTLWLQMKATDTSPPRGKHPSKPIETKHLRYYQTCRFPVLIVYWIKPQDAFYYVFAQHYIRETLERNKPHWRKQKTVTITFPPESRLDDIQDLDRIATEGYFYVLQQQLGAEHGGAIYWLDGIPQSDSEELKERTIRALQHAADEQHQAAIEEFEAILRVCTPSPTERMSILLNLGNAHYRLGHTDEALRCYTDMIGTTTKVSAESTLQGKAAALGNMGSIYAVKGNLDAALQYVKDALAIDRQIGYRQGEANQLGNMGIIYADKGELDTALQYHHDALVIHRDIGYRQGEAAALSNTGLIFKAKGDLDAALQYHQDALIIHREIGYRQGEASNLGNMGLVFNAKGDLDAALRHHQDALVIFQETGYRQGEASQLGNIGLIYSTKGDLDAALQYLKQALIIDREIGDRQGEANQLGNTGNIYSANGDLDAALQCLQEALVIDREIGYRQGEANQLGNIGNIYADKGDLDAALRYYQEALVIHREMGYRQGEALDLGNIGNIYADKGDLDAALRYHQEALVIHREIGHRQGEANQLGNIGLIYYAEGDLDAALQYLKEALHILDQHGLVYGRDIIERAIATIDSDRRECQ